ncbi:MAG: DUF711 family protein [Actinobacteria bacterium]|nr:DUF711 family protein [Actinomycetota bacterium]
MTTSERIVRTVCLFCREPNPGAEDRLRSVAATLISAGFEVQTLRICCPAADPGQLMEIFPAEDLLLSAGTVSFASLPATLPALYSSSRLFLNCDLTNEVIGPEHAGLLIDMAHRYPEATFRFAFTFRNAASSPYFPSAAYARDGFAVGLQSTNLAVGCTSLEQWLNRMQAVWQDLVRLLDGEYPGERRKDCAHPADHFLGIDSSVAPLFKGPGSLIRLTRELGPGFDRAVTTDFFLRTTAFLAHANPRPVGLCGLMFPCLEDFELAEEYDRGRFSLERNLFLALHSGLGVDTYPFGTDENPARLAEVLRLVQGLARKHAKPLSVRLVSDGRARIGERTHFQNPYLKDVSVRAL